MDKNNLIEITNQLYQLTLLFPKKEPLRYKMRELADEILVNFLRIKISSNPSFKAVEGALQLFEDLEILDSYFAIANLQNWVTPSKLFSIREEYDRIKKYLIELKKENSFAVNQEREQPVSEKKKDLNERQQKILEILREKEKAQVWELEKFSRG